MRRVPGTKLHNHTGESMSFPTPKRMTTRKVSVVVKRERNLGKRLERFLRKKIRSGPSLGDRKEDEAGWASRVRNVFVDKQIPAHKPIAIYAHFNPAGTVSQMVVEQLRVLKNEGFEIVFVTMSPVPADKVALLENLICFGFERRSFGRDFGAWKDAWQHFRQQFVDAPEILLTNDSILGPVRPFAPVMASLRSIDEGVLGLTDSPDHSPHLQSYFLLFRGSKALLGLDLFFEQLRCSFNKKNMIERGELALSTFLLGKKVPLYTLFSYEEIEAEYLNDRDLLRELMASASIILKEFSLNEEKLLLSDDGKGIQGDFNWIRMRMKARLWSMVFNPTHFFWRHLVQVHNFPFIKTELVTLNPSYVFDAADWREVINEDSPITIDVLEEHLSLMMSGS